METLPIELRIAVTETLPYQDILRLCRTETIMRRVCQRDSFWLHLLQCRYPHLPYFLGEEYSPRGLFRNYETTNNILITASNGAILYLTATDNKEIHAIIGGYILALAQMTPEEAGQASIEIYLPGGKKVSDIAQEKMFQQASNASLLPSTKKQLVFQNLNGTQWKTTMTDKTTIELVYRIADFFDHEVLVYDYTR